ncbi:hypothetical protein GCM10027277_50110 [Pseudoduganella ginsengisoli]|uniref:Uncharacterized protein n=1 Tax=Pseudoduganella ginsengisoli TaxID=1462440 RepID=A0A6L6Q581_9BURK|nr:hypothetical protein [Pseudoduganella ginsengisoli]MTW04629.1 hypothetical protein [Pseudoduganella ginsengisoli]
MDKDSKLWVLYSFLLQLDRGQTPCLTWQVHDGIVCATGGMNLRSPLIGTPVPRLRRLGIDTCRLNVVSASLLALHAESPGELAYAMAYAEHETGELGLRRRA